MTMTIDRDHTERMVALRRELHRHPELSWQEHATVERVCRYLDDIGVSYHRPLPTGIVAELSGDTSLPMVAIRADMDALPVTEETGLPFSSEVPGVMHACGHDGHTSMALGALDLLVRDRDRRGPVRCLFQPAEEQGAGARAMMEAGALDGVTMIFGVHVDVQHDTGVIVVHDGAVNASTDAFTIGIEGRGGHAARPHECVDVVAVGSLLVTAIQTIVSREMDPINPVVITVGTFTAGTAPNVIADQATLQGTIRTQDRETRDLAVAALRRISGSIGDAHGARVAVTLGAGTPVVDNQPEATSMARRAAQRVVPQSQVVPLSSANMGGEDFAYYLERVAGCFVRLGARIGGSGGHPAHSSRFDFDEAVLPIGARYFQEVVKEAHSAAPRG